MLSCSYRCTKFMIDLSSLEIIDRTKYVRSILHYRFYNLYDLNAGMQKATDWGYSFHNTLKFVLEKAFSKILR
jgi:hypothetical protein